MPPSVPGEFVVRLGEGWGGSLHDLAGELAGWELDPRVAVALLLTWLEWVEVRGFDDAELCRLRGAVMVACAAAVG